MKKLHFCCLLGAVFLVTTCPGQGYFSYDQQSSVDQSFVPGGGSILGLAPYGQSFTPLSSTMNFIRLGVYDKVPNNGLGATLYLNLRTDSIGGSIIASSQSILLGNGYSGFTDFFFDSPVVLAPGDLYVFEIVAEPGSDNWGASAGEYLYSGGMAFGGGLSVPGSDLWFREGTYTVPEPSVAAILLLGAAVFMWRQRPMKM